MTPCMDMQKLYRLKLRASITVKVIGGRFWLGADWTDWYQMVSHVPTDNDLTQFVADATAWAVTR